MYKEGTTKYCDAVGGWMPIDARPKESKRWVVEETASLGVGAVMSNSSSEAGAEGIRLLCASRNPAYRGISGTEHGFMLGLIV